MTQGDLNRDDVVQLLDLAVFGKEVEEFFDTNAGRYLLQCADVEAAQGYELLKSVDPTDYKAVANAQAKVWRGESFKQWLGEAIASGLEAAFSLEKLEGDQP